MLKKQTKVWLALAIALSLLALAAGCSKKEGAGDTNKSEGPTTGKAYASKGDEGTVTGTIAFNGAAPAPKKIDTSADPVCGQKSPNLSTEDTVVNNGKLANAFVYIKDGTLADGTKITEITFTTPPDAVTLDQNGCHYRPHVLG